MNARAIPLVHPALEGRAGRGSGAGDAQRIGAVLQAAALLSHLRRVGWRLRDGFRGAEVDGEGVLRSVEVEAGARRRPPQVALRELLLVLLGEGGEIFGKGRPRKLARTLLGLWRHDVPAQPADRLVEQILDEAPWLWDGDFAGARRALAAEDLRPGRRWLIVAGPPAFRRRLRHAADFEPEAAREILASPRARELFQVDVPSGRIASASHLYDRGRFETALRVLQGQKGRRARILRVWCRSRLGQNRSARAVLRRLEDEALSGEELLEVAAAAVRVFACLGSPELAKDWLARARQRCRGRESLKLGLLEAEAAWDRQDSAAMKTALAFSEAASGDGELAWRWHHARGLAAMADDDGESVVAEIGQSLRVGRRRLRPFEAGALWNDLAVGRVWVGDLAGAERACRHSLHWLGRCQGAKVQTLLTNLAEVRLRRGLTEGVEEILEGSLRFNRETGNRRGEVHDLELFVRLDLLRGRLRSALTRIRDVLAEADEAVEARLSILKALEARALGWRGRRAEAEAALEGIDPASLSELDPVERPAVWALAGRRDEALQAAAGSEQESLWRSVLRGDPILSEGWAMLAAMETFHAARLVLDLHLVCGEAVPAKWRSRAHAILREAGAESLAELLEEARPAPWSLITAYLSLERPSPEDLARLFVEAGCPDHRLERQDGAGRTELLLGGEGGDEEISTLSGGARWILRGPFVDDVARFLLAWACREWPRLSVGEARSGAPLPARIIGRDPTFVAAIERATRLAKGNLPILVLGESGTGKELVAEAIHEASPRRNGTFLPLNCAALPESLLMADLFGHVRGAYTGADRDRPGIFETARGGTVFLDEIGDLPLPAQGAFLRVLQEQEIRRVGESLPRKVDVRVVSATHRDLDAMVREGRFRQDLLFRLRAGRIVLPPLRERGDDLLSIARHCLAGLAFGSGMTRSAERVLRAYSWPGNVRELANVLEAASLDADGGPIDALHLDVEEEAEEAKGSYQKKVDDLRRRLISEALEASGGNRAEAARRLGMTRQSLSYLIRKLGIEVP